MGVMSGVRVEEINSMFEVWRHNLLFAVASTREEAEALARSSWVFEAVEWGRRLRPARAY